MKNAIECGACGAQSGTLVQNGDEYTCLCCIVGRLEKSEALVKLLPLTADQVRIVPGAQAVWVTPDIATKSVRQTGSGLQAVYDSDDDIETTVPFSLTFSSEAACRAAQQEQPS